MTMKRRKFLGLLGGGVVAGPQAVKSAAEMSMVDLRTQGIGAFAGATTAMPEAAQKTWASERLKRLAGITAPEREYRIRNIDVHSLPEDIAVLRSVSIGTKIRMSRPVIYERSDRQERNWLDGIVKGWWD